MEIWPNFIIVGAPKAGTTALFQYLNQHPKVYLSKIKEPGYFRSFIPKNVIPPPITSKKKYLELFRDVKKEVAVGEASAVYLNDPGTAKIIHDTIPTCKIIIMLRDPIDRTYSSYFQTRRIENEMQNFGEAIRRDYRDIQEGKPVSALIRSSFYSEQVQRYVNTFGPKQVKIIISEEFFKDVKRTVGEVLNFLGIHEIHEFDDSPKNYYQETKSSFIQWLLRKKTIKKIGYSLIPWRYRVKIGEKIIWKEGKKPVMSKEDEDFLKRIFTNDVIKLQEILDRKLPWFINKD